jgi:flagellar biosynthesis protein FlhB
MEKDFEELKELFQQKKASGTLSAGVIHQKASADFSKLKRNHLKNIVTLLATAIALVLINKVNAEKMMTSAWGLTILLICALYYAASKAYLLYRLQAIRPTESVLRTIEKLERYKKLNTFMHTYGEVLYVLVLSLGVYLYMRPVMDKFLLDTTGRTILCFWWIWGVLIVWMLIHTFVIKRRRLKKDIAILEDYLKLLRTSS